MEGELQLKSTLGLTRYTDGMVDGPKNTMSYGIGLVWSNAINNFFGIAPEISFTSDHFYSDSRFNYLQAD